MEKRVTKKEIVKSNNGLLTTIAWGINGEIEYANIFVFFIAFIPLRVLRRWLLRPQT